jgi:hypothetical protein
MRFTNEPEPLPSQARRRLLRTDMHRYFFPLFIASLLCMTPLSALAQQPEEDPPPAEEEEPPESGDEEGDTGDEGTEEEGEEGEKDDPPAKDPEEQDGAEEGEADEGGEDEEVMSEEIKAELKRRAIEELKAREAEKEENTLTPEELEEQRFDAAFGVSTQLREKEQARQRAENATGDVEYFLPEDPSNAPQLDYNEPIVCAYRPGSNVMVRMQCDHEKKECLVAEEAVFHTLPNSEGGDKNNPEIVPTDSVPEQLSGCYRLIQQEEFALLESRGYTLIPALLEIPHGYKRDERGRAFQTHFDLRSRLLLGVYYMGSVADSYGQTLAIETRSSYEHIGHSKKRRHRFSFIEGEFVLSPIRARALLFDYNYGRVNNEPLFYITNLIGEPSRTDVYMRIGKGLTLGRLDYQSYANAPDQTMLDMVAGRLQWEILQGFGLEDYFMLSTASGFGTRRIGNDDAGSVYFYPELGFKAIWLQSPRGLFQLATEGRVRYAFEPDIGSAWQMAIASASAEWVMLAISDQPISLYARPEARFMNIPSDGIQQGDFRFMAGIRFNFFAPPPTDPVEVERQFSSQSY